MSCGTITCGCKDLSGQSCIFSVAGVCRRWSGRLPCTSATRQAWANTVFEILESEVNRRCSTSRTRAVGEEDLWNRLVSEVGSHETAQPAKKKGSTTRTPLSLSRSSKKLVVVVGGDGMNECLSLTNLNRPLAPHGRVMRPSDIPHIFQILCWSANNLVRAAHQPNKTIRPAVSWRQTDVV